MSRIAWPVAACLGLLGFAAPGAAWDGEDRDRGAAVTIQPGALVQQGLPVEVYDWSTGEYRDVDVLDMLDTGSGWEIEVLDHGSGETRTLEMEE